MQPGAVGSAVVGREASGGEAHRCDRTSTAGSGKRNGKLIAERWPAEVQGSAEFTEQRPQHLSKAT